MGLEDRSACGFVESGQVKEDFTPRTMPTHTPR